MRNAGWLALFSALTLVGCKSDFDLDHGNDDVNDNDDNDTGGVEDPDGPQIRIEPSAIGFGTKLPDCPTEPSYFTVSNYGERDLNITSIDFDGSNGAFELDLAGIHDFANGELTIAPGGQVQLPVVFEAQQRGVAYTGLLEIASNDADDPVETAGVEGAGGDTATQEDLFFQDQPNGVDVLWVLDNSCSMSGHITDLENEFDSFIASFTTLGLDYQLAVTTTDMDTDRGALLGPVPVISPSLAAAAGTTVAQAFDDAVEPNSSGSADEQALMAAKTTLSPGGAAYEAGFIRPDANLAVIVVGDEDDGSSLSAGAFVSWFEGVKGDPEMTTASGIIQQTSSLFDTNCSGIGSPKLQDAIDNTGGIRTGICDLDFDQVLRWLSYSAAGLDSVFPLSAEPLNGPVGMSVTVNGTEVPRSRLTTDGFSYVQNTNSVVFTGDTIPGPGAEVRIEYPVAGECN